jgi:hypothetical protein
MLLACQQEIKSAKDLEEATQEIIIDFNRYGHNVREIITDDEKCLATLRLSLGKLGVTVQPIPAGLHEKKAERFIQTIKSCKRAMLANQRTWSAKPSWIRSTG